MLWILLACTTPSPEQVALDPGVALEEAVEGCRTLDTPVRQGRCVLDALSVRDAVSLSSCSEVPGDRWRGECLFQVAERSTGPLRDRYAICKQTGEYERECGFHIWQKARVEELICFIKNEIACSFGMQLTCFDGF